MPSEAEDQRAVRLSTLCCVGGGVRGVGGVWVVWRVVVVGVWQGLERVRGREKERGWRGRRKRTCGVEG